MMRFAAFFIALLFLLTAPVTAQDGYPLPDSLQPITAENAAQIKPLASIGGVLPADLNWSNDGKILIVSTSAGTQLYIADQLQQAPIQITSTDVVYNARFTDQGELIVNNDHRIDPLTGKLVKINPPPKPLLSPSGKIEIKVRQTDAETLIDLKKLSTKQITLHTGTKDAFNQIVFSPDEQNALLILDEIVDEYTTVPAISYWNINTGKRIIDSIQALGFPSRTDFLVGGKLLLIESYSDAQYGGPFQQLDIFDGHTGKIVSAGGYFMDSSWNGKLFAISRGGQLDIWSNHLIGSVPTNEYFEEEPQSPVIFSPNSNTLANTVGKSITLWDITDDSTPAAPRVTIPTADTITKLIYSPDGKLLISVEANGIIEVWDALTGAKYPPFAFLSGRSLYNPVMSWNGMFIRANEQDGDTFVWSVATGKQVMSLPPKTTFSSDGLHAAYWEGGSVQVVDIPTNQQTTLTILQNKLGMITRFIPQNGLAVFKGSDSQVVYNLQTGQELAYPLNVDLASVQFSPNFAYFMTRSERQDNREDLSVWRTDNLDKPVSKIETPSKDDQLLLSPDGNVISESSWDQAKCTGIYRLWSSRNDRQSEVYSSESCGPQDQTFSPDSKWLLVGWEGALDVVNVDAALQNQPNAVTIISMYVDDPIAQSYVTPILFSPDGQTVALVRSFNFGFEGVPDFHYRVSLVQFSDLLALKEGDDISQIETAIPDAKSAFFSPDSRWLLTDIGLWNLTTHQLTSAPSTRISVFSPDSSLLATINPNTHQVELWDVSKLNSDTVSPLTIIEAPKTRSTYLDQLAFSPDGKLLYLKHEGDIQLYGIPAANS